MKPPIHFPSDMYSSDHEWVEDTQEGAGFEGGLDLESLPFNQPPQVKDSPMFEDESYENESYKESSKGQREEL